MTGDMPRRRTARQTPVQVRVSFAERRRWRRTATAYDMTLSDLVRSAVRDRVLRLAEARHALEGQEQELARPGTSPPGSRR
jgi:hypothetical protein